MNNNLKTLPVVTVEKTLSISAILSSMAFSTFVYANTNNPLLGSWEWVNSENNCAEIYVFATDNKAQITSGDEISEVEYHLSDELTERGFNKLTLKILNDKGGKDCAESLEDNTGHTYHKFVMFHPSGEQYVSCDKETIEECVGPLTKIK